MEEFKFHSLTDKSLVVHGQFCVHELLQLSFLVPGLVLQFSVLPLC